MKLTVLKKALEHYLDIEPEEALSALRSLETVTERYADKDIWHDEVFVITPWTLDEMLNRLAYDIYGKLKKTHGDNLQFQYFANACRKDFAMEQLTDEQLMVGYEIIGSLWHDNEAEGNHSPDGTYNK